MEQHLVDDMTQDGAHNLCDEECGNGNVHRRLIDPDRTDNMETIIVPFDGLEINVIRSRHGHGEGELVMDGFFLGLDVEILEPDPIHRKEDLFGVVEQNIDFAPLVVVILGVLKNLVRAHF